MTYASNNNAVLIVPTEEIPYQAAHIHPRSNTQGFLEQGRLRAGESTLWEAPPELGLLKGC